MLLFGFTASHTYHLTLIVSFKLGFFSFFLRYFYFALFFFLFFKKKRWNAKSFVVLRVIGALAIVYVTLSLSALGFTAPITRARIVIVYTRARHKPIKSTRVHGRD